MKSSMSVSKLPPGLGKIRQRVAENLVRQLIGDGDVVQGRFDVVAQVRVVPQRTLHLVQERHRQNQLQVPWDDPVGRAGALRG